MIGLRLDNDQVQKKRTYRFAEKLNGRFFVSGVSGSFQKYSKFLQKMEEKDEKLEKNEKYAYAPVMEKHRKEELKKEAQRLMEIEEKLNEIQRTKEMRRKRDRLRRRRKLEYQSASLIQRAFRIFVRRKGENASTIIISFLRMLNAKSAVTAGAWASSVLKRFFNGVCYRFISNRRLRREAQIAALGSWDIVRDVACLWTEARRATSDEFVYATIGKATRSAFIKLMKATSPRKPVKNSKKRRPKPNSTSDKYSQFFLTEFDSSNPDAVDFSDEEEFADYFDKTFSPNGGQSTSVGKTEKTESGAGVQGNSNSFRYSTSNNQPVIVKKHKTYDASDAKARRIIELHKKKVDAMETERLRRLDAIEQNRIAVEKQVISKQQQETEERLTKETAKAEFFKKLEEDLIIQRKSVQDQNKLQAMSAKKTFEAQKSEDALNNVKPLGNRRPSEAFSKEVGGNGSDSRPSSHSNVYRSLVRTKLTSSEPPPPAVAPLKERVPVFPRPAVPKPVVNPVMVQKAAREQLKKAYDVGSIFADVSAALAEQKAKKQQLDSLLELTVKHMEQERYMKYTSEEALARTRDTIKKRIAAKMNRNVQKQQMEAAQEIERKEKLQKVLVEAQLNLKKNIENKKKKKLMKLRKSLERRTREAEVGSPPAPPLPMPSMSADGQMTMEESARFEGEMNAWHAANELHQQAVDGDGSDDGSDSFDEDDEEDVQGNEQHDNEGDRQSEEEKEEDEEEEEEEYVVGGENETEENTEDGNHTERSKVSASSSKHADRRGGSGMDSPLEYAGISSAREEYTPLEQEFGFDDFFSKSKLTKVYTAPVDSAQLAAGTAAVNDSNKTSVAVATNSPPSKPHQKTEKKSSIPKGAPLAPAVKIPSFLQATPYFNDYKKHQQQQPIIKTVEAPASALFEQQANKPSVPSPVINDGVANVQSKNKKASNKVDSLKEMISRARCVLGEAAIVTAQQQQQQQQQQPNSNSNYNRDRNMPSGNVADDATRVEPTSINNEGDRNAGSRETTPYSSVPSASQPPQQLNVAIAPTAAANSAVISTPVSMSNMTEHFLFKSKPNIRIPGFPSNSFEQQPQSNSNVASSGFFAAGNNGNSSMKKSKSSTTTTNKARKDKSAAVGSSTPKIPEVVENSLNNSAKLRKMSKLKKNLPTDHHRYASHRQNNKSNKNRGGDDDDEEDDYDFEKSLEEAEHLYESKLMADYKLLRSQFDSKLQDAVRQSSELLMQPTTRASNSGGDENGSKKRNGTSVEGISTAGEAQQLSQQQQPSEQPARMSVDELMQFSVKDLLKTWAIEDAMTSQQQQQQQQRNEGFPLGKEIDETNGTGLLSLGALSSVPVSSSNSSKKDNQQQQQRNQFPGGGRPTQRYATANNSASDDDDDDGDDDDDDDDYNDYRLKKKQQQSQQQPQPQQPMSSDGIASEKTLTRTQLMYKQLIANSDPFSAPTAVEDTRVVGAAAVSATGGRGNDSGGALNKDYKGILPSDGGGITDEAATALLAALHARGMQQQQQQQQYNNANSPLPLPVEGNRGGIVSSGNSVSSRMKQPQQAADFSDEAALRMIANLQSKIKNTNSNA